MRIFVINLDRDRERLASFAAQMKQLGLDYERVAAIDGSRLPNESRRSAVNRFRWWCAIGLPARDGEIGCALSHVNAWERGFGAWNADTGSFGHVCGAGDPNEHMAQEESLCVLEDDVVLDQRFGDVLKRVESVIDCSKPQVVLLSNHSAPMHSGNSSEGYQSAEDCPFEIRRITEDLYAEGYIITMKAAVAIRRANWPLVVPADHWRRWARRGLIELYHAFPTVCSQKKDAFASRIFVSDLMQVNDMSLGRKTWHKMKRLVGVSIDCVLGWWGL